MRYLYYCNSAYQLLTIMNLHWHRKHADFESIDNYEGELLILNSFAGAEDIKNVLVNNNVFDNVRLIQKTFNSGIFHGVYTLLDVLFPSFYLKHQHNISTREIKNRYDVIVIPKYTAILGAILRENKKARLHLFEDGLGSYSLNMDLLTPHSRLQKMVFESGLVRSFKEFEKLYLNVPELYAGPSDIEIVKNPKFDEKYLSDVRLMFKDFYDDRQDKDIYWLSQTLENDKTIRIVEDTLSVLEPYKERVLYCPHPRWPEKVKKNFDYSLDKQIWELKLLQTKDLEGKLLISIHSTACLTPKMLYDKEPYLILFYKMIDDKVTERNDKFDVKINAFINMYRDKSKIMLPSNKEEFIECINKYLKTK